MFKSLLINIIEKDPISNFSFQGCFASDEIPNIQKNNFAILNTDSAEKAGEHWTVLYRGNGDLYEFFESFGQPPKIYSFKNFPQKYIYNNLMLQNPFENNCGYFCLYFIFFKCRGKKLSDIFNNSLINDRYIKMLVNNLFEYK